MAPKSLVGGVLRAQEDVSESQLGRETQKEAELRDRLEKWHQNSNKRVFVIQDEPVLPVRKKA